MNNTSQRTLIPISSIYFVDILFKCDYEEEEDDSDDDGQLKLQRIGSLSKRRNRCIESLIFFFLIFIFILFILEKKMIVLIERLRYS